MDTSPAPERRHVAWAAVTVSALAAAAVVAVVLGVPLVLTNDGPQGTFQAWVESQAGDPSAIASKQFELGVGLGGRGYHLLYRAVAAFVPFPGAYRISQVLMALASAASVVGLSWSVHRRLAPTAVLGFALAFSWPFFMGFFPFVVATAASLAVVAGVVASPNPTIVRRLVLSLALVLVLALAHPVPAALGLVASAAVVGARARGELDPDERADATRAAVTWMGVTAVPFAVVFLLMATTQGELSAVKSSGGLAWPTWREWALATPKMALPGGGALGWIAVALAALSLSLGVRRGEAGARALAAVGLALLVAALVGPIDVPGWQYFAPRLFVPAFAVAVAVAPAPSTTRGVLASLAASVLIAGGALAFARRATIHHAAACRDAVEGLFHKIPRKGMQLPVLFDSMCGLPLAPEDNVVPHLQPGLHLHALFAVHHGGSTPFAFHGPPLVHVLTARTPPPAPMPPLALWGLAEGGPITGKPEVRARALDDMAAVGLDYEDLLLFGATDVDEAQLRARGYATDVRFGKFLSARPSPCAVDVAVPKRPGDPPFMVAGGLGSPRWAAEYREADGVVIGRFEGLCGAIAAVVRWQRPELRCLNAGPDGVLALTAKPGTTTRVSCER